MQNNEQIAVNEQLAVEQFIKQLLKDLSRPNAVRLKAGITVLLTAELPDFEKITSKSVQTELMDLKNLLLQPESLAPLTCQEQAGRKTMIDHIKIFTLNNLNIIDERITILPNAETVKKTLLGGERLKSVVHASAMRNVVTAAYFSDTIEKKFKKEGFSGRVLEEKVKRATESMATLHTAVINNDLPTFKKDLKVEGIDVNLPNPDGLPLLHLAVRENHPDMVKLLMEFPTINVNLVSNTGWTPLHYAARLGFSACITLLLTSKHIQVNAVNSDGWTPLHWAAWQGNTSAVTALLSSDTIDINKRDSSQSTPLHWAARNGQADVIAILLAAPSVQANVTDIDGKTPLHYAVSFDHASATATLLAQDTLDVNVQDIDGLTALHWAARNGRSELVDLLIEVPGIRFDLKDHNEMTPFDWAVKNEFTTLLPKLSTKKPALSLRPLVATLFRTFKQVWNRG